MVNKYALNSAFNWLVESILYPKKVIRNISERLIRGDPYSLVNIDC